MKKTIPCLIIAAATASTTAYGFGEVGKWSSGWGQGTAEYTVADSHRNSLYIACSDTDPVSMTLTIGKRQYGSNSNLGFDLVVDGKEIQTPYKTDSRVGSNNFYYMWDALRKAKTLRAKTSDGAAIDLPVTNVAKTLPPSKSREFGCKTSF